MSGLPHSTDTWDAWAQKKMNARTLCKGAFCYPRQSNPECVACYAQNPQMPHEVVHEQEE